MVTSAQTLKYKVDLGGIVRDVEVVESIPVAKQAKSAATLKVKREQERVSSLALQKQVAEAQERATFVHLPLSGLVVEKSFQRKLDENWALKEAMRFDWRLFGLLCVVPLEEELYSVVDGQHRKAMLDVLLFDGNTQVPCEVVPCASYEERAWLFRTKNERRRQPSFGAFLRARIEEQDTQAIEFMLILQRMGFTLDILHERNTRDPYDLRSPRTLWRIYEQGGAEILKQVLLIHRTAFGQDPAAYQNYSFMGTYSLLYRYVGNENFSIKELIKRLSAKSAQQVWSIAAEEAPTFGKEKATAWAIALHFIYNYGRQERNRLPAFALGRGGSTKGVKKSIKVR